VRADRALVDIEAVHTVALEALIAGASERSLGVRARGVGGTVVGADFALVDLVAGHSVAEEARFALAVEGTDLVLAVGVHRAHILASLAFVNIFALTAIALETSSTGADEAGVGVGTDCIFVAVVGTQSALVRICGGGSGSGGR